MAGLLAAKGAGQALQQLQAAAVGGMTLTEVAEGEGVLPAGRTA